MQAIVSIDLGIFFRQELRSAPTLLRGGELAASIIKSIPGGVEMVFGPITRGGIILRDHPSFAANLRAIERTILLLEQAEEVDHPIFNQLIFKAFIDKHRRVWLEKHKRTPGTYHEPVINEFYAPILNTGNVVVGHFLHGWKKGKTAKFAHEQLAKQEKDIHELPKGFHERRLQAA